MLKTFCASCVICYFGLSGILSGQQVSYTMEHYSVNDGLPDHRIMTLVQHSAGFVWLGTWHGLCRFDGHRFVPVELTGDLDLLTNGIIREMRELANGKILIRATSVATPGAEGSVYLFDPAGFTAERISMDTFSSLLGESVENDVAQGIRQVSANTGEGVTTIAYEDQYGNRLVGSYHNTKPINANLILATGEHLDISDVWSTLHSVIPPVSNDMSDVTFLCSQNGLVKIAVRRSPFELIMHEDGAQWEYLNICRSMTEINADSILISVENEGLYVYDRNKGTATIAYDGKLQGRDLRQFYFRSLWTDPRKGWVYGPHFSSIIRFDPANNTCAMPLDARDMTLASVFDTRFGYIVARILSGTRDYYIELIDLETQTAESIEFGAGHDILTKARPTYILPASDSTIWYGTKTGLFLLDVRHGEIRHLFLEKEAVRKTYPVPVSYVLSGPHVWVLHSSVDGKLWLGMDDAGINILDVNTYQIEYLSVDDGLSNNTVVGILPDQYGYWFSTFNGLSHYDTATAQFRNFYISNGISHNEFNRFAFLHGYDGKYYFGSMNGITAFYPDEVLGYGDSVSLLISEVHTFLANGVPVMQTNFSGQSGTIVIPSNNRYMSVRLALSDYSDPGANTFFYKLQSLHRFSDSRQWSALGSSAEVGFENLEAGQYALHLRGVSAAGVPSDEIIIPMRVRQFFYRTWWFIGSCMMAIALLIYAFYRLRLRQALRMERLRTRLSSDLHDDVGGLLSGVAFQMEAMGHTVDQKHRNQINRLARSSRKAMEQMRDTIWAIDTRRETMSDLKDRMLEFAEEVLGALDIEFSIDMSDVSSKMTLSTAVRHNFLLIYKEFVNNSIKHAHASKVDVHFRKQGRKLEMWLMDDGVGMDNEKQRGTGQGLMNIEMRVKKLHGTMRYPDGEGFRICIQVPVRGTTRFRG